MAQNNTQILTQILHVVTQIRDQGSKKSSGLKGDDDNDAAKMGGQMSGFLGKDADPKSIKETGEAIKILASGIGMLSKKILGWWLIPKKAKTSLINFMKEILSLTGGRVDAAKAGKLIAESMVLLGEALPKLAKGVRKFGFAQITGQVTATVMGLRALYGVMVMIGNPATAPLVLVAASAIGAIGLALQGIGDVLKGLAAVMMSFAASMLIMVGAIWLATKLFSEEGKKVGPLEAMLIIVGAIGILGAGFALIGVLSPLILGAGVAIAAMGTGMALLGAGLLIFLGSAAIIKNKMGLDPGEAIKSMVKPILLLSLLFAGIGIISPLILPGALAAAAMGKGLLWLSGGILAIGAVGALLKVMNVDDEVFKMMSKGIARIALTFALVGLFSPLIMAGVGPMMLLSVSLGLFALIVLGIGAIIKKLGGEEGLKDVQNNIALMISSVLIGVVKGVSMGLLGENGASKGFFGKIGAVAKNTAILISSIGLLIGVSIALIMFGWAIKAFTKAGSIKMVTGYDAEGKPIYGEEVNVVNAGENIAKSIGAFFTTLTETFKDPSIIPDKATIMELVDILMGNTGFKMFGILKVPKQPGLLDAISKFAEVIQTFAKVNQIPYTGPDGKTLYSTPQEVAGNIVSTLVTFFGAFKENQSKLEGISSDAVQNFAEILLGRSSLRILGLRTGKDKPGLLEPIMEFAKMIDIVSKNPREITYIDENGKKQTMSATQAAKNIISSVTSFATEIKTSLDKLDKQDFKTSNSGALNSIKELNGELAVIAESQSKLVSAASALDKLATSVESFSVALQSLELEKLELIAQIGKERNVAGINQMSDNIGTRANNVSGMLTEREGRREARSEERSEREARREERSEERSLPPPVKTEAEKPETKRQRKEKEDKKDETLNKLPQAIGQAVAAAFNNGQFTFDFATDKSGVLTFET